MGFKDSFRKFSHKTSTAVGSPLAFGLAIASIILWAVCGPFYHYSDTWQLVVNTSTTIITFLMVFLIQNSQNRDGKAIHLKLDELIRSIATARNELMNLEELGDDELEKLQLEFKNLHDEVTCHLEKRGILEEEDTTKS
jgi:low affinity Fe/Cu permease